MSATQLMMNDRLSSIYFLFFRKSILACGAKLVAICCLAYDQLAAIPVCGPCYPFRSGIINDGTAVIQSITTSPPITTGWDGRHQPTSHLPPSFSLHRTYNRAPNPPCSHTTMILFLALYSLLSRGVKAEDPVDCSTSADDYRSQSDIVWSCLTTIFLCTWVSLHPNVPEPVDETKLSKRQRYIHKLHAFLKDQVLPFMLVFFAPEWVLMWAIRQRLVVEYLVRMRTGLTRTYAFFIIMGGFHKFSRIKNPQWAPSNPVSSDPLLILGVEKRSTDKSKEEHGVPEHPLDRFDVCRLLDSGKLRLPPEVEIDDKSKSDWIAKSLVLIQTIWFVIQCIARGIEHLPLTELEVVTLGYTLLNLIIYVMWWDKPQKVTRPIRVFCGDLPERCYEQKVFKVGMDSADQFTKLSALVFKVQDIYVDLRSLKQTPTFYSGNPPETWPFEFFSIGRIALLVTAVIGGVFGGLHLIAWSSTFPTHEMQASWRRASVIMTAFPGTTIVYCIIDPIYLGFVPEIKNAFLRVICDWIFGIPWMLSLAASVFFLPFIYFGVRLTTLIIAFQSLSSLTPEALRSIQWTNLFPHI